VTALNRNAVLAALKAVIVELDYDPSKALDRDEKTGEDTWDEWVDKFDLSYRAAVGQTDAQRALTLPMSENDAGAATIQDYLIALLARVWDQQEGFSGKRPFGNSGWDWDTYPPLIKAGLIDGKLSEDGYVEEADDNAGQRLIAEAIQALS
jgi:hypothetical protein